MNWSKLTDVLVLAVLLTHVFAVTSAIECYECETSKSGACGNEFKEDKASTCNNGGICRKIINKHKGNLTKTWAWDTSL